MARPSDKLNLAMVDIGRSLEVIASATRGASSVDTMALDYMVQGFARACQWRKDLTETARRHAYGAASAGVALASAPQLTTGGEVGQLGRRALVTFGAALKKALDGDAIGALAAARQAAALCQPLTDGNAFRTHRSRPV